MFRLDTVDDTTPEVTALIKAISTPGLTAHPASADDTTNKSLSVLKEHNLVEDASHLTEAPRIFGHVLLSSMPRVSALARRRELLVQKTRGAANSPSSSDVVIVRLVLSLLSTSATGSTLAPTDTHKHDAQPPTCSTLTSTAGNRTAHSARLSPAISLPLSSTDAPSLPWCSARGDDETAEITYAARCLDDCPGGHSPGRSDEGDGQRLGSADPSPALSSAARGAACVCCQVVVRSYPVAVFSSDAMHALAQYWHCDTSPALQGDATTDGKQKTPTPALSTSASCVTSALDEFRERVRRHELHSLLSVARTCEALLRELDACRQSEDSTNSQGREAMEGVASRERAVTHSSKLLIPVPIYGAHLSVEDNQATRLERVGHLTTPLLREVTGEQSPMRPLTAVLHQIRVWAAETPQIQPPNAPSSEQHEAPSTLLLLTRARLLHLREDVRHFIEGESLSRPANYPPDSVATAWDLESRCPLDVLLPACLVHCQLGVSRSPSVVLLFYMDVFRASCRLAARLRSREQHQGGDACVSEGQTTGAGSQPSVTALEVDVAVMAVFQDLLSALVRARARVKPNLCFAVQLLSLWKKCMS
ncbi:hypothetical protein ABL78_2255 [Leptomonas seymouri]|uniref:Tyrosine specific protein phosphatases domain-containing protein n=1 Tax=Leptomonas seymouri TaxID=5684 RepID=A0A0N1PEI5_LEPSE|nr:hypothetical protein ABL78_2255 [Leptomonas seymouri]|eukprot:KPI88651.1 hypothetical protein ABL78_2255 [Leptomonas seymouri]